jgi:hypothetical protein
MNSQDATDQLAKARRAVDQATQEVEDVRQAVSVGQATSRDVYLAVRRLDRTREKAAQAESDLTVAARREQAERDAQKAENARIQAALREIYTKKAGDVAAKYATWLRGVQSEAQAFNAQLVDLEQRVGRGVFNVPNRFTSFSLLSTACADQLTHFERVTFGNKES